MYIISVSYFWGIAWFLFFHVRTFKTGTGIFILCFEKKKKILFLQAQVVHVSQTFSTAFKKAQRKQKSPYSVKWSLKRNLQSKVF